MGKRLKDSVNLCRDSGYEVEDAFKCQSLGSLDSILDALDDVIDDVLQKAPPRVCKGSLRSYPFFPLLSCMSLEVVLWYAIMPCIITKSKECQIADGLRRWLVIKGGGLDF